MGKPTKRRRRRTLFLGKNEKIQNISTIVTPLIFNSSFQFATNATFYLLYHRSINITNQLICKNVDRNEIHQNRRWRGDGQNDRVRIQRSTGLFEEGLRKGQRIESGETPMVRILRRPIQQRGQKMHHHVKKRKDVRPNVATPNMAWAQTRTTSGIASLQMFFFFAAVSLRSK